MRAQSRRWLSRDRGRSRTPLRPATARERDRQEPTRGGRRLPRWRKRRPAAAREAEVLTTSHALPWSFVQLPLINRHASLPFPLFQRLVKLPHLAGEPGIRSQRRRPFGRKVEPMIEHDPGRAAGEYDG